MKQARARLRVSPAGVEEAWAEAPQRWTLQRTAVDGWTEVAHQLLGEGAFGGDTTRTSIHVEVGGQAIVRAVAATPLRGKGVSTSAVRLRCDSGGALIYLPGALVPQVGSRHASGLTVEVREGARVVAAQVITPGRSGMGERGRFASLRLRTTVRVAGEVAFADDALVEPECADIDGPTGFAGAGAAVSVLVVGAWTAAEVDDLRVIVGMAAATGGISRLREGGVAYRGLCRTLGDAQDVIRAIEVWAREAGSERPDKNAAVNFCSHVRITFETTPV